MSQDFLRSLDLDDSIYSNENFLVVHDAAKTDGSYVLHHLVADFAKRFVNNQEGHVLLILNHQTLNHWNSVSTKLGWNLSACQAKSKIAVLDMMQETYKKLTRKQELNVVNENVTVDIDRMHCWCEDRLNEIILKHPEGTDNISGTERKRILIVIEDLTSLFYTMNDDRSKEKSLTVLTQKLRNLGVSSSGIEISFATLVSSAGGIFSSTVAHSLATVLFEVSPLQTGFSHVFHGYFAVTKRPVDIRDKKRLHKSYQYKLEDRQIQFSPLTKYNF